jgi:uncharacterized membrane protein YphA (DoxX/SURF4 family)
VTGRCSAPGYSPLAAFWSPLAAFWMELILTTGLVSVTAHLHPGGFFALLAGLTEFGGAIALGLCLLTRLAGLAIFGDMVITMITVTWATGINSGNPPPGYQLNLALGVLALVVGMFGAGRFSVDSVIAHRLAKRQPPDEQTTVTGRQSPLATTPPTMLESPSSGAVVTEPRMSI